MPIRSAGILLHRLRNDQTEIFLIHPGGPYWSQKDLGAWSIPKGIVTPDENPLAAARREFEEETGHAPLGLATAFGTFRQPSGKQLMVWAIEGDIDPEKLISNNFAIIWPPKSGILHQFPEADRGDWFSLERALTHITKGQRPIVEMFFSHLRKHQDLAGVTAHLDRPTRK